MELELYTRIIQQKNKERLFPVIEDCFASLIIISIFKNSRIKAAQIKRVKKYEQGFIKDPVCLAPDNTVEDLLKTKETHGFSGIPITGKFFSHFYSYKIYDFEKTLSVSGKPGTELVGLVTSRDIDFLKPNEYGKKISEVMTPKSQLGPGLFRSFVGKVLSSYLMCFLIM